MTVNPRKSTLSGLSSVKPRPLAEKRPEPTLVQAPDSPSTSSRRAPADDDGTAAVEGAPAGGTRAAATTVSERLSVNFFCEQDYRDMRSAYQIEYDDDQVPGIVNLKTWFAHAVDEYASKTPSQRAAFRARVGKEREGIRAKKIVRSLDITKMTRDTITEAVYEDYTAGASRISASQFATEAIRSMVERTEERRPRPWPDPQGRLPSKPQSPSRG